MLIPITKVETYEVICPICLWDYVSLSERGAAQEIHSHMNFVHTEEENWAVAY